MSDIGFLGLQNFGYFSIFPKFENGMKDWGQNSTGAARMPPPFLVVRARADRRSKHNYRRQRFGQSVCDELARMNGQTAKSGGKPAFLTTRLSEGAVPFPRMPFKFGRNAQQGEALGKEGGLAPALSMVGSTTHLAADAAPLFLPLPIDNRLVGAAQHLIEQRIRTQRL